MGTKTLEEVADKSELWQSRRECNTHKNADSWLVPTSGPWRWGKRKGRWRLGSLLGLIIEDRELGDERARRMYERM
jgi:hypothetical protein